MSYAYTNNGMGFIEAIGSIVEPLAVGGALAYKTYADDRAQSRELKARKAEAIQIAEIRKREAALQAEVAQKLAPIRAEQFKLVASGLALVGAVGLAGFFVMKLGRKK